MALPPLIPLEHFFDNPEKAGAKISPDGTRLSYLAPEKGRLNVWVRSVAGDDDTRVTHDHVRGIGEDTEVHAHPEVNLGRPVMPSRTGDLLAVVHMVDDTSHEGQRGLLHKEGDSFQVMIKTFKQSNDPSIFGFE